MEIRSIEETEIEPFDEANGDVEVEERPRPPIWHRRCKRCDIVYNVLKTKCPKCGRR